MINSLFVLHQVHLPRVPLTRRTSQPNSSQDGELGDLDWAENQGGTIIKIKKQQLYHRLILKTVNCSNCSSRVVQLDMIDLAISATNGQAY